MAEIFSPAADHTATISLVQVPRPLSRRDLEALARFLAKDHSIAHNPLLAGHYGVGWYRVQIGEDVCSMSDAVTLRDLTIALCRKDREASRKVLRRCNRTKQPLWLPEWLLEGLKLLALVALAVAVYLVLCTDENFDPVFAPSAPAQVVSQR